MRRLAPVIPQRLDNSSGGTRTAMVSVSTEVRRLFCLAQGDGAMPNRTERQDQHTDKHGRSRPIQY
jgi:hypothetical protein